MGSAMWKYVLAWIPMVFIAIINGAIREGWYGKHVSELHDIDKSAWHTASS
jgi:hypothetical protein